MVENNTRGGRDSVKRKRFTSKGMESVRSAASSGSKTLRYGRSTRKGSPLKNEGSDTEVTGDTAIFVALVIRSDR